MTNGPIDRYKLLWRPMVVYCTESGNAVVEKDSKANSHDSQIPIVVVLVMDVVFDVPVPNRGKTNERLSVCSTWSRRRVDIIIWRL